MTQEKITFDDLMIQVLMEEDRPTPEALKRWTERFPQFRKELAENFEAWRQLEELSNTGPELEIDEEQIVAKTVAYALEELRRQGRIIEDDAPIPALTLTDQIVLAAVFIFHGKGEAIALTDRVKQLLGQDVLIATVLAALDRLAAQHLISASSSDPRSESDSKSRRYFAITLFGERTLALAKETSREVAGFLGEYA